MPRTLLCPGRDRGWRKGHHTVNQNTVAVIPARPDSESRALHFPGMDLSSSKKKDGLQGLVSGYSNAPGLGEETGQKQGQREAGLQ